MDPHLIKTESSETRFKRLWFGANARVTIRRGFLHIAGFGSLVVPHPALANWLLRLNLPGYLSRNLSYAHEFAHFQTAPLLLAYTLAVIVLAYMKGRTGIGEGVFLIVSVQAAWEIVSEALVMLEDFTAYQASYQGITRLPRIIFWTVAGILAAAGWVVVLHT